jgi:hypothetical protein
MKSIYHVPPPPIYRDGKLNFIGYMSLILHAKPICLSNKHTCHQRLSPNTLLVHLLALLFVNLIFVPCYSHLIVTVGQDPQHDFNDFQNAIDYVLSVENENEVTIKLAEGDYFPVTPYTINIGLSGIQKLHISPINMIEEVWIKQDSLAVEDMSIEIVGNGLENKEIIIENISFDQGIYLSSKGIYTYKGFKKIEIDHCYFKNLGRAIYLDTIPSYGTTNELEIANCTFEYPYIPYVDLYPLCIHYKSYSPHNYLDLFSVKISDNVFTGNMRDHISLDLHNSIPTVVIENNTFDSIALSHTGNQLDVGAGISIQIQNKVVSQRLV